jgi:hypothetical protein
MAEKGGKAQGHRAVQDDGELLPRNEQPEILNLALSAHPGSDEVAVLTNLAVFARLDIKALIEINRGAGLFQTRAEPCPTAQDEVDTIRARNESPGQCVGADAARPLLFNPALSLDVGIGWRGHDGSDADDGSLFNHHLRIANGRSPAYCRSYGAER